MRVDSQELPLSVHPLCQLLPCHLGPPRPTLSINLYVTCCIDCTIGVFHIADLFDHCPVILPQTFEVCLCQWPNLTGMEHWAPHRRAIHAASHALKERGWEERTGSRSLNFFQVVFTPVVAESSLQEVQASTTDHALCLSCIYSQSFLLHCIFSSQEPPDTFLERFSDNIKVNGIEVLPGDPRVELTWQGFEEQWAEYRALVNTDLHFTLFIIPLTNTDTAPHIGIHPLHQSHNPLLHTKFSQLPPDDLPRHSIKHLLKV